MTYSEKCISSLPEELEWCSIFNNPKRQTEEEQVGELTVCSDREVARESARREKLMRYKDGRTLFGWNVQPWHLSTILMSSHIFSLKSEISPCCRCYWLCRSIPYLFPSTLPNPPQSPASRSPSCSHPPPCRSQGPLSPSTWARQGSGWRQPLWGQPSWWRAGKWQLVRATNGQVAFWGQGRARLPKHYCTIGIAGSEGPTHRKWVELCFCCDGLNPRFWEVMALPLGYSLLTLKT